MINSDHSSTLYSLFDLLPLLDKVSAFSNEPMIQQRYPNVHKLAAIITLFDQVRSRVVHTTFFFLRRKHSSHIHSKIIRA